MYTLERFGSVSLPQQRPDQFAGVGSLGGQFSPLASGGVSDPFGSAQATLKGAQIRLAGAISTRSQSAAALETEERALRALWGKRDKLYRRWADSGELEWCTARLVDYQAQRQVSGNYLDVAITFQMISPTWYGAGHGLEWYLDDGYFLDDALYLDQGAGDSHALAVGPNVVNVTNGGNATVRNAKIKITAAGGTVTAIKIAGNDAELTWSGSLTAGNAIYFDCGSYEVYLAGGSTVYNGFALGASHAIDDWFHLVPGLNTVTITLTGAAGAVLFTFSDGWL